MKTIRGLLVALVILASGFVPASADAQNDAGSGADAGNTFAAATPVALNASYEGRLDTAAGDIDDFYKFPVAAGGFASVLVTAYVSTTDPMELLDPAGNVVDTGARIASVGFAASNAWTTDVTQVRLAVHHAIIGGDYRLHLQTPNQNLGPYSLCFMDCDALRDTPIELIFGGSLEHLNTKVLLIPPTHGDLGNPLGPTVLDYINATLRGIHKWTTELARFADDNPRFDYLKKITVSVEIFDGVTPADPAGYDVVIGYVAAGPAFRGVATDADVLDLKSVFRDTGVHYSGRYIALSLYGSSPRAGQVLWDFPEINDLEIVTTHEFGHTFGLGHSTHWDAVYGPDIMNSPAPFIYGDGSPAGDGGERTAMKCLSSLDLYGMAELYSWVPNGAWEPSGGFVGLPNDISYRWYC